jgi:hypothetical protein
MCSAHDWRSPLLIIRHSTPSRMVVVHRLARAPIELMLWGARAPVEQAARLKREDDLAVAALLCGFR